MIGRWWERRAKAAPEVRQVAVIKLTNKRKRSPRVHFVVRVNEWILATSPPSLPHIPDDVPSGLPFSLFLPGEPLPPPPPFALRSRTLQFPAAYLSSPSRLPLFTRYFALFFVLRAVSRIGIKIGKNHEWSGRNSRVAITACIREKNTEKTFFLMKIEIFRQSFIFSKFGLGFISFVCHLAINYER